MLTIRMAVVDSVFVPVSPSMVTLVPFFICVEVEKVTVIVLRWQGYGLLWLIEAVTNSQPWPALLPPAYVWNAARVMRPSLPARASNDPVPPNTAVYAENSELDQDPSPSESYSPKRYSSTEGTTSESSTHTGSGNVAGSVEGVGQSNSSLKQTFHGVSISLVAGSHSPGV